MLFCSGTNANAAPESTSGSLAGPSFYLNDERLSQARDSQTPISSGRGLLIPRIHSERDSTASANRKSSEYCGKLVTPGSVSFADFYLSGRAPEFVFFNVGIERSITKDMTLSVNYVGDQSHFVSTGGNARGYWANQLNPIYLTGLEPVTDSTGTKPILIAAATPANVAKAQAAMSGITIPVFYQDAASANPTSSTISIAQGLVAFPQYSGVTDLWGSNSANLTYHSLQISLLKRVSRGLSFNVNYTYSKNIGDDGTFRSGFDIPAAAISGGGQNWKRHRIDRSWTTVSAPQILHAFGVYELPFGRNHVGGSSMLVRRLAGGWQISGIYTYGSGTPVAVISSACSATTFPLQGQCSGAY